MSNLSTTLFILVILIALNALYVLAEFSAVSSRRARLTQMIEEGNLAAKLVLDIVEDPHKLDAYVATSQVGITISSLMLGFYGQAQLSSYLIPFFSRFGDISEAAALSVSATTVLIVLTLFQVLFGELIPKNLGIQNPERFSIFTLNPMRISYILLKPLISLFNGSGVFLMRVFKIAPSAEHSHIHSPEEISILIEESGEGGVISAGEYRLLSNTMRMRDEMVKTIMIPRAKMLACANDLSISEITKEISTSPFSRIPIYENSIDNIIGIVHMRDLFCALNSKQNESIRLHEIIRPVKFFPETVLVKEVFAELQSSKNQVSIILDEYGGTSGMVTLEDLIEEIFGDIQDEFDQESPRILAINETNLLILGNTPLDDLNILLGIDFPSKDVDTIGGLITKVLGRIPKINDKVSIQGYQFTIQQMDGRAVLSTLLSAPPEVVANFRSHQ